MKIKYKFKCNDVKYSELLNVVSGDFFKLGWQIPICDAVFKCIHMPIFKSDLSSLIISKNFNNEISTRQEKQVFFDNNNCDGNNNNNSESSENNNVDYVDENVDENVDFENYFLEIITDYNISFMLVGNILELLTYFEMKTVNVEMAQEIINRLIHYKIALNSFFILWSCAKDDDDFIKLLNSFCDDFNRTTAIRFNFTDYSERIFKIFTNYKKSCKIYFE